MGSQQCTANMGTSHCSANAPMIVVLIAARMDVGRTPLTEPPPVVLGWRILGNTVRLPAVEKLMPRFVVVVVVVALGSVVDVIVSVMVMVIVTEVVIVAVMDIVVVVVTVSVALAKVANKAAAA